MNKWIDVKKEMPMSGKMAWAAVPNVILCNHQTFLAYLDSDGNWRDCTGLIISRKINFWQYADVPECNISC